jgi:hypothetical protein
VLDEHRQGLGGALIMQAYADRRHAFIPGAVGALAKAYRRIGFVGLPTEWRAKWVRPVRAMFRTLAHKTGIHLSQQPRRAWNLENWSGDIRCWRPSSGAELRTVVEFANQGLDAPIKQYWDEGSFFWRFFHPSGPRHRIVTLHEREEIAGYIVWSLGIRNGISMARVVEWRSDSQKSLSRLLRAAITDARSCGADLFAIFAGELRHNSWLAKSGMSIWKRRPQSLVFHRDTSLRKLPHAFMPSAGDYGFEAFASIAK